MRITIEPGAGLHNEGQHTVILDSNSNDESTTDAVEMALQAIVAYGHNAGNVAGAAKNWAENNKSND